MSAVTIHEFQKLTASDAEEKECFGREAFISGDMAIVGATRDDDGGIDSGAAYIFTNIGGTWTETAKLVAGDATEGDYFGLGVSISGNTAIIGAHKDAVAGDSSGSAYIFENIADTWTEVAKLTASDAAESNAFGWSVSVSGDKAVVGTIYGDSTVADSGSAYIFEKVGGTWTETAKFSSSQCAIK